MGEYWIPTNVTKRQYVHPHRLNNGLKLGEWDDPSTATFRRIQELIREGHWSAKDDIRAFSDYGGELYMHGDPECVSYKTIRNKGGNMYSPAGYLDVSIDNPPPQPSSSEDGLTKMIYADLIPIDGNPHTLYDEPPGPILAVLLEPGSAHFGFYYERQKHGNQIDRTFQVFGTGKPIPAGAKYWGTASDGSRVFHLYELDWKPEVIGTKEDRRKR